MATYDVTQPLGIAGNPGMAPVPVESWYDSAAAVPPAIAGAPTADSGVGIGKIGEAGGGGGGGGTNIRAVPLLVRTIP